MFEIMIMKISHVGKAPHKTTASLPAVKPGTQSVAMAKLQGGNAPDMSLIINDDDDYDSDDRRFSA